MATALLERPEAPAPAPASLAAIEQSLAGLAAQMAQLNERVAWLADEALAQRRARQQWQDLAGDLTPVIHDAYRAAVDELQDLDPHVQLDDLLLLLKRLARNTRNLNQVLDWLESAMDLTHDANRMGREMMTAATDTLAQLEQRGYFDFVREAQYVLDQVVTSFSPADVRLLGDNVVLILNTVKALTQPQIMTLLNNLTQGFHSAEAEVTPDDTRLLSLLRTLRDPAVRRGLAVTLATLKRVAPPA